MLIAAFIAGDLFGGLLLPDTDQPAEPRPTRTAPTLPLPTPPAPAVDGEDAQSLPSGEAEVADEPLAAAAPEEPVLLSGEGKLNTAPFELAGGDYRVTAELKSSCGYYFNLHKAGADRYDFREPLVSGGEVGIVESYVYGIEPGVFYVGVNTGSPPSCAWILRIEPLTAS